MRRRSQAAASLRRRAPARSRRLRSRAAVRCLKLKPAVFVPAGPAMAQHESHTRESSRRSHARNSGEALKAFGNTRPLEPTKVACPSASLQSRSASAETRRWRLRDAAPPRRSARETRQRFAVREVEPAAPGHQEFAAGGRHRVVDSDVGAALRQHFGGHQAGGAGADDGDIIGRWRHATSLGRILTAIKKSSFRDARGAHRIDDRTIAAMDFGFAASRAPE